MCAAKLKLTPTQLRQGYKQNRISTGYYSSYSLKVDIQHLYRYSGTFELQTTNRPALDWS